MTSKYRETWPLRRVFPRIAALVFLLIQTGLMAETLDFSAGRVRSVFAEGREQTVLEDGARVESESLFITGETIRFSGEDNRYIDSRGDVYLLDKDNGVELRAEFMSYDSETENLVLEGDAEFLDQEGDIRVSAAFIERQQDLVVFQIDVQILREDMVARAEYVRYFEDSDKLELSGFPVVFYRGDEYSADLISIFTETDEIILQGQVEGQISEDEDAGADGSGEENTAAPVQSESVTDSPTPVNGPADGETEPGQPAETGPGNTEDGQ